MVRTFAAILTLLPLMASATDAQRITFLEQEVRNLQRQVQSLSRHLDELRTRPDRPATPSDSARSTAPAGGPAQWIDAKRWKQIRPGMSELEVISSLGPPTSMRDEGGARVLLYAIEMGTSGFLGGSVTLRDRTVAEVRPPTLQ
jgi:hypothetical protein